MDPYLPRIVEHELDALLDGLPAIAIEGPKAVGKTRTAERRAGTVRRLDDPADREVLRSLPISLIAGPKPILLDEWQRLPEIWDQVRRAVDEDSQPGRFLLTGSATPTQKPTHTGAGRIARIRMRPLSFAERRVSQPTVSMGAVLDGGRAPVEGSTSLTLADYAQEIVASGFPAIRTLEGRQHRAQLDGYLSNIVEREFEDLGHPARNQGALRRWMTAYAAATSTTAAFETIRDAATSGEGQKPARSTTLPYRNTLEQLWIIDDVPAWAPTSNRIARLGGAPTHQLVDPALAARLLGIGTGALLEGARTGPSIPRDGTLFGALFESLVTLSVRVYAQAAEARVFHLRTKRGDHEIDLIVERPDGRVLAIEVKLTRSVDSADIRHLEWLANKIGPDLIDWVVITAGPEAYRRSDGIAVVPLALLGA